MKSKVRAEEIQQLIRHNMPLSTKPEQYALGCIAGILGRVESGPKKLRAIRDVIACYEENQKGIQS